MASPIASRRTQRTILYSLFVLLFVCSMSSLLKKQQPLPPPGPISNHSAIIRTAYRVFRESILGQIEVAMRIAKPLLLTEDKDKNMVFSPLSIHVALSLMAAGTKGTTKNQLLYFLKSNSTANLNSFASDLVPSIFADASSYGGPHLSFANGLWVDKALSLKHSFKQVVDIVYKAARNQVDFKSKAEEARMEVNSWAEKETNGLIKRILPPGSVNSLTRSVFANALYFKGAWDQKFDASRTKEQDFHLPEGGSVKASFITSDKKQFVSAFEGFKVLGLPYSQGGDEGELRRFSMYLILPDARDGLRALVDKICSEPGFLQSYLPYSKVELSDFKIPRFKFSSNFQASEILKDLGLVLPFTSGLTEIADLPLVGAKVLHESSIEVNEEGSEAAAVTAMLLSGSSFSGPKKIEKIEFVADHPFMFVLREERTRTVLFIGQVLNPLAG